MKVSNETQPVPGQHFKIIVNGREKIVTQHELSYVDVVRLAFENPDFGENIIYTVTYKRGPDHNPEGSMVAGDTVEVKPGMIFNVTRTDKS
jgi:hypothetical protein